MAGRPGETTSLAKRETLELAKVIERGKTLRVLIVSIAATVSVGMVVIGAVKIAKIAVEPLWLCLVLALIGPFLSTPVIKMLLLARKKYINKHHQRVVDLEKRLDPTRESSEERTKP